MPHPFDAIFPRYTGFDPDVPVWCVTPDTDRVFHRFHSSSPFSPSGRYMALTRLAAEDRLPQPGDVAEIVIVDLETGKARIAAETRGADTQLGAQAQWGASDSQLFYNDVDTDNWTPFAVELDPATGAKRRLEAGVYMASPDGRHLATPCLVRTGSTQAGYGVIVPPETVPVNKGAMDDDGVYITDVVTGKARLIASYRRIMDECVPRIDCEERYGPGTCYGFHVKWNPQGDRLMFVIRYVPDAGIDGTKVVKGKPMLITLKPDGSDIRLAMPTSEWADKGGVHPAWQPDGEHIIMNLNLYEEGMLFVEALYDGSDLRPLCSVRASHGHCTLHPDGRHILTDVYPKEEVAPGDGSATVWWVDREADTCRKIIRIHNTPPYTGPKNELRVDAHPAWDPSTFRRFAINGCADGTRRVYVADVSSLLASSDLKA